MIRDTDGSVLRVAEAGTAGDATPEELEIREVNAGVYAFEVEALKAALGTLDPDNAQGELYLPDVLPAIRAAGHTVAAHLIGDPISRTASTTGSTSRTRTRSPSGGSSKRTCATGSRSSTASTRIDAGVVIGRDTTIEPFTQLKGTTAIGESSVVGAFTTLIDTHVGDGVTILQSHLNQARVDDRAIVGPFATCAPARTCTSAPRPGRSSRSRTPRSRRDQGAASVVIGDADVGEGTNIGAGNITANYDGRRKHRTTIGANVRTSVDTAFVAPVTVGDDAYTAPAA